MSKSLRIGSALIILWGSAWAQWLSRAISLPVLPRPLVFQNLSVKDGLSSDMILSIAVREGEVWFGTYAGGATLYTPADRKFKAYTTKGEPQDPFDNGVSIRWKNRLPYNHVSAVQADGEQVWFGTNFYGYGGGGVSCYRPKKKNPWKLFNTADRLAKRIVSLAVETDGVWVGSEKGLTYLDKKTGQWGSFYSSKNGLAGNYVNAILDEPEFLWIATNAGVSRLDKAGKMWPIAAVGVGLADADVKALARMGDMVWAGTSDGRLYACGPGQAVWTEIEVPAALPHGGINGLAVSGHLVFVCRDDGVDVFDSIFGRWEGLTSADGLPSDTVLCASPAPDGIWFGTDQGASFLRTAPPEQGKQP